MKESEVKDDFREELTIKLSSECRWQRNKCTGTKRDYSEVRVT